MKGQSRVDLTLTGDMLENMYVSSTNVSGVTISIDDSDYGKLRGAEEGIKRKDKLVKRPFFHLSKEDKEAILDDPILQRTLQRAVVKELQKTNK